MPLAIAPERRPVGPHAEQMESSGTVARDLEGELAVGAKTLNSKAGELLSKHDWPGNVRELVNGIEQAAVLTAGTVIEEPDLNLPDVGPGDAAAGEDLSGLPFGQAKRRAVEGFERAFLLRALRENGGNISRAAESIGMVRQSLQQKIRELELRSEDWTANE